MLAGTAVTALLISLTQAIVLRDLDTLDDYRFWVVGSAAGRDLDVFWQVLPFMLVGLLLAAISAPGLNLLQLGDDVGRVARHAPDPAQGHRRRRRDAAGRRGDRRLRTDRRSSAWSCRTSPGSSPASTTAGWSRTPRCSAGCCWSSPTCSGRVIVRPGELQVGIVMALVGGPVFIVLVRRTRMVRI